MSAPYYGQYSPVAPGPRRAPLWPVVLLLASVVAVLFYYYWPPPWLGKPPASLNDPTAAPRPVQPRGDLGADEQATIKVFKDAAPRVVYITTLSERRDPFSLSVEEVPQGTGSGFMWDDKGNVVTNFHVVQNAKALEVTLDDGSTWKARLVGGAPDQDLAVVKIDAPSSKLKPLPLGSSADLQVGQKVLAIGNPFGLDQTLTTGVISAVNRQIKSGTPRPIKGVIQTDAAINPGNSGGPLLDSAGRLIGVNTAIYSPSGAYAGIGFAIPVDTVNRIVPELIRAGKVDRPGLGIHVAPDAQVRRMGLPGVLIIDVLPDGPAAKAGLKPTRRDEEGRLRLGDVITRIDNRAIKKSADLYDQLSKHKVGDVLKVTIDRDGQALVIEVTLEGV